MHCSAYYIIRSVPRRSWLQSFLFTDHINYANKFTDHFQSIYRFFLSFSNETLFCRRCQPCKLGLSPSTYPPTLRPHPSPPPFSTRPSDHDPELLWTKLMLSAKQDLWTKKHIILYLPGYNLHISKPDYTFPRIIQKYTKFAIFIALYFAHFTIFCKRTSQFD